MESLAKDLKALIRFMKRFKCGQAIAKAEAPLKELDDEKTNVAENLP